MKKACSFLAALACLTIGTSALAGGTMDGQPFYGILGARMWATGDTIEATVGNFGAANWNYLYLYRVDASSTTGLTALEWRMNDTDPWSPGGYLGANQNEVGTTKQFNVATGKGTEIVVGIINSSYAYYSGAGNASYQTTDVPNAHAKIDFGVNGQAFKGIVDGINYDNTKFGGPVLVGFEDLPFNKSDLDYNDATVVSLTGVSSVPEPGTILGVLAILAPAGMLFRRKN